MSTNTDEIKNVHSSQRKVYKLGVSCGRNGEFSGLFTAHPEDIELIMGTEIYFGEVFGKYSEVIVEISDNLITKVPASGEVIEWLESDKIGHAIRDDWRPFDSYTISGHNPFEYVDEEIFEDEDE